MKDFNFKIPQNIQFGMGSLKKLPEILAENHSDNILLVSDRGLEKIGVVKKVQDIIEAAGLKCTSYLDVVPNPTVAVVNEATALYKECGATSIVALGGGSSMDVGKAVGVLVNYGGKITDYEGNHKVPGPIVPMIAIPTTAGTGSEVTASAVITDTERNYKLSVFSYEILPKYAVLDPELIMTAPASIAASCGVDALIHAMEAYTSIHATPLTDMWAEHAIALIAPNLRKAWARGEDIQARQAMLTGSFYAGVAFCNAGVTAVHAFAYPIGARYHIPHGLANTLMLLPVFRFNMVGNMERFARLAAMLGENTTGLSHEKAAGRCLDALESLARDLQVPRHLADYGVTPDDVPVLAESVLQVTRLLGNNPRSVSLQDAINIYREAL